MDTDDLEAGLCVRFHERTAARGDLLVELDHGRVLLGLAVGRLAGHLRDPVVTAGRQHDEDDPENPCLQVLSVESWALQWERMRVRSRVSALRSRTSRHRANTVAANANARAASNREWIKSGLLR